MPKPFPQDPSPAQRGLYILRIDFGPVSETELFQDPERVRRDALNIAVRTSETHQHDMGAANRYDIDQLELGLLDLRRARQRLEEYWIYQGIADRRHL